MNSPAVSVIIPVYNVEDYLRECLDSVIRQTEKNIEIICVDDGSTDSSPAILQEYAQKDSRISIVTKTNGGLSSARNAGLAAAGGEYIYFLDSDDYILDDALEILLKNARKDKVDILFFGADCFFEDPQMQNSFASEIFYYRRRSIARCSGPEMLDKMIQRRTYCVGVPLQFLNRAFLLRNGLSFREGILYEDELFTSTALLRAGRAVCISDNLYMRRYRKGSIVTGIVRKRNLDSLYLIISALLMQFSGDKKLHAGEAGLRAAIWNLIGASENIWNKLSDEDKEQLVPSEIPFFSDNYNHLYADDCDENLLRKKRKKDNTFFTYHIRKVLLYFPKKVRTLLFKMKALFESIMKLLFSFGNKIAEILVFTRDNGFLFLSKRIIRKIWKKKRLPVSDKDRGQIITGRDNSISVIIPVYNVEKYLPVCMESVIRSPQQNLEIICVNDGSTDSSLSILSEYAQRDQRVKVINLETNRGLLYARKAGVMAASGAYILFLDSDDYIADDLISFAQNIVQKESADIIQFSAGIECPSGDKKHVKWFQRRLKADDTAYFGVDILSEAFINCSYTTVLWGKILKTSLCKYVYSLLPDEHCYVGEDILTYFFLAYYAKSYVGIDSKEYYFYRYGLGVSNNEYVSLQKFEVYCKMAKWARYIYNVLIINDSNAAVNKAYKAVVKRMFRDCNEIYKSRIQYKEKDQAYRILSIYWQGFSEIQLPVEKA